MMQGQTHQAHGAQEDQVMGSLLSQENFKDLHENWLVEFLEKGGFQALVSILEAFVSQ
jgi:hypothetical protein